MSASERLDEIQARYSEWHQDRGHHTPAPETDTWPDADHPNESMDHCIVRNDVPALVAALRAVLDVLDRELAEPYNPESERLAQRARTAVTDALGVSS